MSQQMEFDEARRQQQQHDPSFDNYDAGYRDPYIAGSYGQKISMQPVQNSNASAGQRLALAIVSICLLVPLTGTVLGIAIPLAGFLGLVTSAIIMAMICAAIIGVNIAFNYRH